MGGAHGSYDVLGINFDTHTITMRNLEEIIKGGKHNGFLVNLLVRKIVAEKMHRLYEGESIKLSDVEELSSEVRTSLDNTNALTFVISKISEPEKSQGHCLNFIFPHYSMGSYAEGSYSIEIELEQIEPELTHWAKDVLFH